MIRKVYVIGAGVSGLTTAVVLQEAGYAVEILTKHLPMATNSARAGAIWFPTRVGPPEKVAIWGRAAYQRFEELTKDLESGVSMVDLSLLGTEEGNEKPYWMEVVPEERFRNAEKDDLPEGFEGGFLVRVPFIEPEIYLPYLMGRFEEGGGRTKQYRLENFDDPILNGALTVNCAGLGAAGLTGDKDIFPIYGHTLRIPPLAQAVHLVNDQAPDQLAYIFSRSQDTLLGGTATEDPHFDAELAYQGILERASRLNQAVGSVKILGRSKGARPYRKAIRLERERQNLLHNYGHGGAGFTVSWGCAEEILRLLNGN